MYGQDNSSDFLQWFLGYDPCFPSGSNLEIIQHDANDIYHGQRYRGYDDAECTHVENDEIIARTLQEEFSQLEITENSQNSYTGEEYLQASTNTNHWHDQPTENYYSGHEHGQDGYEYSVPSSSCSSPSDSEESSYPLELTDEDVLDGEVGKRLNQMVPIPHIPRINGEIPSTDEAMSDHERLLNRLQLYGFVENKVQGDGNCQFRALSDQLYSTPEHHKLVRRKVVNQLKSHPDIYKEYVPMDYADYLKMMSKNGEWGDHVTLQAAADSYGVKIVVMTSFKDTYYIEILPNVKKSKGVIFLSFWAEVHYNSIYFQGDIPSSDLTKKKKWWIFGN